MFAPHVILHPTDLSDTSRSVYPLAVALARTYHARLLLLHVGHLPTPSDISFTEAETEPQPAGYHNRLAQEMHKLYPPPAPSPERGDPEVPVEYLVREGVPADEILAAAQERHCDLIVLATHGRSGLQRLLLGSTAEQVARRASCPVLTTRPEALEDGHGPHLPVREGPDAARKE